MVRRLLPLLIVLAACRTAMPSGSRDDGQPFDVVITNGKVVDGTGAAWFYGDVALRGDRIARVAPAGLLANAAAKRRVDATGMVVAPGFIDIQGQSYDPFLFGDGRNVSKITQGITTEILGEGGTPAPSNGEVIAWLTNPSTAAESAQVRVMRTFDGEHGFAKWLDAMAAHGVSSNVGSFVGAHTVRVYAMGQARGTATAAQLDTMRSVVRRSMRDGAFGVGSALIYPPGNYASTEELVEIVRASAPFGGLYITHMRSEGDQFLEAIDEAIRIGREGGVPVEIYHLKAAGKRNWTKGAQAVAKIDSARARGLDVQADMYAYVAGATSLAACIPPWAAANGKLLDNLKDAATRAKVVAEMQQEFTSWESLCQLATPAGVMVVGFQKPEHKQYEGQRLAEIAQAQNKPWIDALIDLTIAERASLGMVVFLMSDENVALFMRQPWMKFGTDADGYDPDSAKSMTHPRAYGNYPRVFGKFVREDKVIGLEEAVRKSSSAVATRLSIPDRGVLREGMYADVVVFDPTTIADRNSFAKPHALSVGMRSVFVNGVEVLRDGVHTGMKPGRIVRGPGYGR
jgi:N-acyl-D-amino-acid deacylase